MNPNFAFYNSHLNVTVPWKQPLITYTNVYSIYAFNHRLSHSGLKIQRLVCLGRDYSNSIACLIKGTVGNPGIIING